MEPKFHVRRLEIVMRRWLIPVFLTISASAFAQYGGITLPGGIQLGSPYPTGGQYPGGQGGQYPGGQGGQYPTNGQCPGGQYPTNGQCPGGQYPQGGGIQLPGRNGGGQGMMEYVTGMLRQLSMGDLEMQTDDGRVIRMMVPSNVRYNTNFGAGRMSDFDPGDNVTVQGTRDMNNYYRASIITLNRKGTVEDRKVAMRPPDSPMDSGQNSGRGSGSGSNSSGSSNSDDASDPGRPKMRRADPASSDDSSPSSSSSRPTASGSSRGDDSVQTARNTSPMSDDPGPPVLRRGAPARDQAAASGDRTSDSVPARPSVRAEEVNGVTKLPVAPPPVETADLRGGGLNSLANIPPGTADGEDPIIDKAREEAFAFTESLPNYIVKQFTTRYQSESASRGKTSWQAVDIVTADVLAENGKETYKNMMVNGKPTKDVDKSGSWSEGEFASTLQAILSPASDALFTNRRSTTIVNRPAYRYDYSIEQPRSSWQVYVGGSRYRPAYGGAIWIDKATSRVLRIEMSARGLPRDFQLDSVESAVDYDFVLIGDNKFLLPTHSEALSCQRGTTSCSRNVIDFRNYKKYGADSAITFENPVK